MRHDSDNLTFFFILSDVNDMVDGDGPSESKKTSSEELPRRVEKTESRLANEEESGDLEAVGKKMFLPFNIIDISTRLEVLLGLKLSGHSDTLEETGNQRDEF